MFGVVVSTPAEIHGRNIVYAVCVAVVFRCLMRSLLLLLFWIFPFTVDFVDGAHSAQAEQQSKTCEKEREEFNNLDLFRLNCFRINNERANG